VSLQETHKRLLAATLLSASHKLLKERYAYILAGKTTLVNPWKQNTPIYWGVDALAVDNCLQKVFHRGLFRRYFLR
jgi:hypothetical protein